MTPPLSREEILRQLAEILSRYAVKKFIPAEDISLYQDGLWIYGDDADELLEEIHATFGTDFRALDFQKYFPNETEYPRLSDFVARIFRAKVRKNEPLRIGQLIDAIQAGVWREPTQDAG